jgi:chromosomal replication initiator protein
MTTTLSTVFITMPYKWVDEHNWLVNPITPSEIIKIVSLYLAVTEQEMEGIWRKREVVLARQMAMVMLRNFTDLSLKNIGIIFGGRDHTTVIHAVHTIQDLCDTDEKIRNDFYAITLKIKRNVNQRH